MTRPCITGRWASLAQMQACPKLAAAMQLAAAPFVELRLDALADASPEVLGRAVQHFGPHRLVVTCRGAAERGGVEGGRGAATDALHAADADDAVLAADAAHAAGADGAQVAAATPQPGLSDSERRTLWLTAHKLGVAFIDVDLVAWLADAALRRQLTSAATGAQAPSQIIASQHHFAGVPPPAQLWASYRAAAASGARVFKLAYAVACPTDALPVLTWAREVEAEQALGGRAQPTLLPLAMGPAGSWSRMLVARQRTPAPLTYVCLEARAGMEAAQPTLADAVTAGGLAAIDAQTPLYGILGHPLGHSRSPMLHNRLLRRHGRAGLYVRFEVPAAPAKFLQGLALALDVRGLSVTLPHKHGVAAACVCRSLLARQSLAINTLVRAPAGRATGRRAWRGSNTDGPALVASVRARLPGGLVNRRCLVLGTGGTAAVAAAAMRAVGARVAIWGRREAAVAALLTSLQQHAGAGPAVQAIDVAGLHAALAQADVLIHATSVGMAPDVEACLLSAQALRCLGAHALVVDCIYTPAPTELLRRAAARGLATLDGTAMFLRQAQGQARAFYGLRPTLAELTQLMLPQG